MTASIQADTTTFPWEQWSMLPREEREAEMLEALKRNTQDNDVRDLNNIGFDEAGEDTKVSDYLKLTGLGYSIGGVMLIGAGVTAHVGAAFVVAGGVVNLTGQVLGVFGLDEAESGANDFTSGQELDSLTGLQMSTTAAIYQDVVDVGDEAVGFNAYHIYTMGEAFGWWDVSSSDMAIVEGNQFDDTFKSLSASDLPEDQKSDAIADLLPTATDHLA